MKQYQQQQQLQKWCQGIHFQKPISKTETENRKKGGKTKTDSKKFNKQQNYADIKKYKIKKN